MSVLAFDLGEMEDAELALVCDSWLRGSHWARSKMLRALRDGVVMCARKDGVVLGWMCANGDTVQHAFTKAAYRQLGVCRALWDALGRPPVLAEPATRRGKQVLRHLLAA